MPETGQTDAAPGTGDVEALLDFLATREVNCPACGYNLRMLRKPACPECGLPLKLTVGSSEPYKRAWAITLCINAMIAGAGVFFVLITLAEGGPQLDGLVTYLWYAGPIVWIPVPLIILVARKLFCRLPHGAQYLTAGLSACWLVLLGVLLVTSL